MSLPDPRPVEVDPFGLWQPQVLPQAQPKAALQAEGMLSFGLPDDNTLTDTEITPTWTLDLTSGPDARSAMQNALALRSQQVAVIEAGLAQAEARAEALLNQRKLAQASATGSASFGIEATALPPPEAELSDLLDSLEQPGVSFGLAETAAAIPWDELRQKLQALMESVNRQLLHFAWVDTRLDNHLLARTAVNWGGDMLSAWDPGLSPDQLAAHQRSLQLAMASRAANLRTILTVAQIAGKLALAVTTPLGPVQALALGWQFVQAVIMPALKEVNR